MKKPDNVFNLEVTVTNRTCAKGEEVGRQNMKEGNVPVLSCEGSCIRGEIARVAANMIAKEGAYRRACHGELFAVPDSAMTNWVKKSDKVVLIDGCFMGCHGRIVEHIIGKENLIRFDALSFYNKYTDRFDIDSVPEAERLETEREVVDWVLSELKKERTMESKKAVNTVSCG